MAEVTLQEVAALSTKDIMTLASSRGYVLQTEAWMQLLCMLLRRPSDVHLDYLREWWINCPSDTRQQAFRLLTSFVPATETLVVAIGSRVMTDVEMQPLSDTQYNVLPVSRLLVEQIPCARCDDPDALWLHLYVHFLFMVVDGKTKKTAEQLGSLLQSIQGDWGNARSEVGSLHLLDQLQALTTGRSNVTIWFRENQALQKQAMTVLTHVWQQWSLKGFGQYSIDFFSRIATVTALVLAVANEIALQTFPVSFLFKVAAGCTVVQVNQLREMVVEGLGNVLASRYNTLHLGPDVIYHMCRILVHIRNLPESFVVVTANIMTTIDSMFTLHFPQDEPFLYERAAHRLMDLIQASKDPKNEVLKLGVAASMSLLKRMAEEHPDLNVIETVFWRLTTILNKLTTDQLFTLSGRISSLLRTPGNRAVIPTLWGLCTDEELKGWRGLFGIVEPRQPEAEPPEDSITQTKMRRLYKFSLTDGAEGVGMETMINHFASQGMTNPFTNEPIGWTTIRAANPGWERL